MISSQMYFRCFDEYLARNSSVFSCSHKDTRVSLSPLSCVVLFVQKHAVYLVNKTFYTVLILALLK